MPVHRDTKYRNEPTALWQPFAPHRPRFATRIRRAKMCRNVPDVLGAPECAIDIETQNEPTAVWESGVADQRSQHDCLIREILIDPE